MPLARYFAFRSWIMSSARVTPVAMQVRPSAVSAGGLNWSAVTKSWTTVTSFGTDPAGFTIEETPYRLHQAFFAAGPLRLRDAPVLGGAVRLAIAGEWPFSDEALATLSAQVINAERAFFHDRSEPRFLVTLKISLRQQPPRFRIAGVLLQYLMQLSRRPIISLIIQQLPRIGCRLRMDSACHKYKNNGNL